MSYFRKPGAGLDEQARTGTEPDELLYHNGGEEPDPAPRRPFGELAGRFSRWMQGLEPEPLSDETVEHDVLGDPSAWETERESAAVGQSPQFPLVRYGYSQAEVDRRLSELERELADREHELVALRQQEKPPMSITEEIERIGEQTASILVVAHDQAHETTRRAQEQAERCIADAAANAVAITAEAKERLRELDDETDAVWRERDRLLEDTRSVSERLAALVDEAVSRFPADADKSSPAPGTSAPF
jgi:DivIVA protein